MPVNVRKAWEGAPDSVEGLLEMTEPAWNLMRYYAIPEVLLWFGRASVLVRNSKKGTVVEYGDVTTVANIIGFPIELPVEPTAPVGLPYYGRREATASIFERQGIIKGHDEFTGAAYDGLHRLAGRSLEMVLLSADEYARLAGSKVITNSHILRQCEDYPYPLNVILC